MRNKQPTAELAEPVLMSLHHSGQSRVCDEPPAWLLAQFKPNRQRDSNRFAFKKTCPFEFTRHGRLQADNPLDLLFCRAD